MPLDHLIWTQKNVTNILHNHRTVTGTCVLAGKSKKRGPRIAGAKKRRNMNPLTTWYRTSLLSEKQCLAVKRLILLTRQA